MKSGSKSQFTLFLLIFRVFSNGISNAQNGNAAFEKPNVIFFSTDDSTTRVNLLGCNQAKTPNPDRLAQMEITFTNAHAPGVFCAPLRSAIFSGLHASTTGCYSDDMYENGIEFVIDTNPDMENYSEKANIGEHDCRHNPNTTKIKYGYFKVDDYVVMPVDNKLTFEITFLDEGTSPLRLQYNSPNSNYESTEITKTDTKNRMTRSFTLTDVAFNSLQNNNSDFKILGDTYIWRIAIHNDALLTGVKPGIKQHRKDIKVNHSQGMLRISVPQDMVHSTLEVYNLTWQLHLQTRINNTEESFLLNTGTYLYIADIRGKNSITTRKLFTSNY